jgi:hypothetical protein
MHQHPRPSTRAAVPASVTHNTPSRQSNTRDIMADRTYSSEDLSSGSQTVRTFDGKEQSLRDKANLVVQHFFTKAALIICSSRVSLPPAMSKTGEAKIDRWVRNLSSTFHSCELAVHPLDHRSTLYCWRTWRLYHCQALLCRRVSAVFAMCHFSTRSTKDKSCPPLPYHYVPSSLYRNHV